MEGWFFDEVTRVASSSTPADEAAIVERHAAAGAMAPLHVRGVDESHLVIDGEISFFVGDETVTARAGEVVVAPRGVARTFRVESEPGARWLVVTRVRSLQRYSDFGRAVSRPVACPESGWPSPEDEAAVTAIAGANGIELLGPPGLLPG